MTDRELLELAAKAAGIDVGPDDFCDPIDRKYSEGLGLWVRAGFADMGRWFNPLNDDGEALRLAVKLSIPVSPETVNGTVWICNGELQVFESFGADPLAATRRAIVRAAAEIGRTK